MRTANAGPQAVRAAYCTYPARRAVAAAIGVEPMTSPPLTAETVDPQALSGLDFLYIRLHGSPIAPDVWFGEEQGGAVEYNRAIEYNRALVPALTAEVLRRADFTGCVVVTGSCYGDQSGLLKVFYERGARAVIAGPGANYAAGRRVIGSDRLARAVLRGLSRGRSPEAALRTARLELLLRLWRPADRDTLAFEIQQKEKIS